MGLLRAPSQTTPRFLPAPEFLATLNLFPSTALPVLNPADGVQRGGALDGQPELLLCSGENDGAWCSACGEPGVVSYYWV